MSIERQPFGKTPTGQDVEIYTLRPKGAATVAKIITYGGHLTELHVPGRDGRAGNVVLGFDSLDGYLKQSAYIGSLVGRFANRIAKGKFTLDGVEYSLPINNNPNTLHGGKIGLHSVVWKAETNDSDPAKPKLILKYISADGTDGFPGTLHVSVTYTLSADSLTIDYNATTDKATPVNLTSHGYFNLKGPGSGDVLSHSMQIAASNYTPVDATLIPTGEIATVKGTPFDFTTAAPIGSRISQIPGGGYDHNYCLDAKGELWKLAARVAEPSTGRVMDVFTTEPGIQFYTGNFLDGSIKGIGGAYNRHGAFCLETQHYPDAVNQPKFPSTILRPGQTYRQTTIHSFSTQPA